MSYEEVYKKGLEVGWSGLSVQEHAVLLYYKDFAIVARKLSGDRRA